MNDANQLQLLQTSAADFSADKKDLARLRTLREKLPGYDTVRLKEYSELGWLGILIPEDYGGLGLGFQEMAVVVEELGKSLLAEPLTATTVLGVRALLHGDNEALKQELLAHASVGDYTPCLAWQEQDGGLDARAVTTRVESGLDDLRLFGRKRFVVGASAASGFLVTAIADDGVGLYLIESGATGLQLSYEWRSDGTPVGVLELDGVLVHAVVAAPGAAVKAVERAIDEAAVIAGAEMLGVIEATLSMTLDYLRMRVQYDRPIGSFQALQHRAADLYILKEISAAVLQEAVEVMDSDASAFDKSFVASRVKSRCGDSALRITREAIQLHGAIGFTDEYDLGLYVKRALVLSAWLGNGAMHRRRIARLSATP